MQNAKNEFLKIRVTIEEKELFEDRAEAIGLSSSEFMRYKLFEENDKPNDKQKLIALQTRMLISIFYRVLHLTEKESTKAELSKIEETIAKEIIKQGVAKGGK